MFFDKFLIPWKIRKAFKCAVNYYHYLKVKKQQVTDTGFRIHFEIPEYGITGGSMAIMEVANLLSKTNQVSFERGYFSDRNTYLSKQVLSKPINESDIDFIIIESGLPESRIRYWLDKNKAVITTNHGYPVKEDAQHRNYGYSNQAIEAVSHLVTAQQFISAAQQNAFRNFGWLNRQSFVIQNFIEKIEKIHFGNHAGIVCDTRLTLKNARRAIQAAEQSLASKVCVWGRYDEKHGGKNVLYRGFSTIKNKIYNDIDVLVLLSFTEVQPLCILEAISCGVPCVISDLECYLEFRGIPGFYFVDPLNQTEATNAINLALKNAEETRSILIDTWQQKYSPSAVEVLWDNLFKALTHHSKAD